ncbi:P-loop NTPase fold protein [Acinetobacter sp. A1-4-2]|uniref:P-loop NTPase fold protein n=1 Tax=Acinetobacter sp. A1-4-2 TaxID=3156489 RepID=A0AAU7SX12_9GAMM
MDQFERLEDIFKNNNKGMAVAITGQWGIGKTFFWNKFINERAKTEEERKYLPFSITQKYPNLFNKKYAYISLFGVESVADLKTAICTNLSSNHFNESSSKNIETPILLKKFISQFRDIKVSHYGISASARLIESLLFAQVSNAIICFDDFERMSNKLDIKDVMGLANQLKLERNCQVILILDESKTEEKNKEKYAEYKEKLIDETIKITSVEPLIRARAKEENIDEPLINLMVKFANELAIHNFRFFQKVIKLYEQFLEQLPSEVADLTKEIILIRILQGYFIEDFGLTCGLSWNDFTFKMAVRREIAKNNEANQSEKENIKLSKLRNISSSFERDDLWMIEFKKWFEQKDSVNFSGLRELVQSELIYEKNQTIKNKVWDIFERRFNFKVEESDFEYLAGIGRDFINNESLNNVAAAYEFIKKYVEDERKAEQFKQDVLKVIDSDIGKAISRKKEELRLWEYPNNIFYEYIDKLVEEYHSEKSLKEIISYYLQYGSFKSEDDRKELKKFSFNEWFQYLTIDIYNEKFILEKDKTLIACLKLLSNISMKSIVVEVLNKIGEESEFKKRFMQDIIENHLD